ncbi:hypothetical protein CK203_049307 [Vitis vinifera]|uniref:Endonuclease/exonuclease/phosphatase domain-containing protein n=1 Tax=Vitis vinifera TaxID=29760 RepID=A0A438FLP7_VITVI|nr:hypothetical protein CK203_049307 [Vitis vinifera]
MQEDKWEESDLAKFSQFLGFPTEGLEKEILKFLSQIRKRREKIHKRLGTGQRAPDCDCPMKMKILSWNVRGANDSSKRKVIKTFIRNQRVDVICIQETKIQAMSDNIARSIGSGRFLEWKAIPECRKWGDWIFTGVYGLFSKMEREALWDELGAIRGLWEDPWCIGGDFNITLFPRERSSQRRMNSAMRKFAEIVDDLGLMDLPLQGGEFTWNGGQNNQVGQDWTAGGKELRLGGSGSYKLATKMKEVKQKLKVWNREVFGKLETNKSLALQQVEVLG